jgi:hypothetical protein
MEGSSCQPLFAFYRLRAADHSMLDTGYWMLDIDFLILCIEYQESSIQYLDT